MKANELFEKIHSGEIKDNTKIEVKTEDGRHITFIEYKNKKLNWISGDFDTRYLCDVDTDFEIVEEGIKKLKLDGLYTGEKIKAIEEKINELIDVIDQKEKYEEFPF